MVFSDRKFIVVRNNADSPTKYDALVALIKAHGGEIVAWDERADGDVSPKLVIVASSADYERAEEMKRFMIPTVTDAWVHACIHEQKLVPMKPYSPDPRNFMRDVIACFSGLSKGDTDVFKAGILASGGECTDIVTRYTSHVVATSLDTHECQLVLESRKNNPDVHIKLVRPEWIDACMSLKVKVDDMPYLLNGQTDHASTGRDQDLTGTFPIKDSPRLAVQQSVREGLGSDILDGRRFFLGGDLELSPRVDKTVAYLIETNGGLITSSLDAAQVYIGKWREGEQYIQASKQRIIVGNITWLYWVMIHQKFEKPNHLLHYPEVKGGLPAMRDFKICITNYTGDARAYLQSLIASIGATYTGKLIENHSTHLITAYESGQKYEAAKRWGIPVINHLWLEDSYAYWQPQDPTSRLYTYFSPKLSMSTLIGTRNLVANVLHKFQKPEELKLAREHHAKRQAKQRAGNWLHDAMILENEFHQKLRRGKLLPDPEETLDENNKEHAEKEKRNGAESEHAVQVEEDQPAKGHEEPGPPASERKRLKRDKPQEPANDTSSAEQDEASNGKSTSPSPGPTSTQPKPKSRTKPASARASPSPSPSTSNRRLMFSGVDEPPSNKACSKIGLSVVKTTPVDILVAPRTLKTVKFLQCLAQTEEFVRPEWVEDCLQAGELLPTDRYRINDTQLLQALEARERLEGRGLFEGIELMLDPELREKLPAFRDLVKAHRGAVVTSQKDGTIVVGERSGQIPFNTFIECIQHMDTSALKPAASL